MILAKLQKVWKRYSRQKKKEENKKKEIQEKDGLDEIQREVQANTPVEKKAQKQELVGESRETEENNGGQTYDASACAQGTSKKKTPDAFDIAGWIQYGKEAKELKINCKNQTSHTPQQLLEGKDYKPQSHQEEDHETLFPANSDDRIVVHTESEEPQQTVKATTAKENVDSHSKDKATSEKSNSGSKPKDEDESKPQDSQQASTGKAHAGSKLQDKEEPKGLLLDALVLDNLLKRWKAKYVKAPKEKSQPVSKPKDEEDSQRPRQATSAKSHSRSKPKDGEESQRSKQATSAKSPSVSKPREEDSQETSQASTVKPHVELTPKGKDSQHASTAKPHSGSKPKGKEEPKGLLLDAFPEKLALLNNLFKNWKARSNATQKSSH